MASIKMDCRPSELSFETIRQVFLALKYKVKGSREKRIKVLHKFINDSILKSTHEAYDVFRLFLPNLDSERGNYHLQEGKLADIAIKAANLGPKSHEGRAAKNWRNPNSAGAGELAEVLKQYVFATHCAFSDLGETSSERDRERARTLKVGELNRLLDELASVTKASEQALVFRRLMNKTTPDQMAWIVRIVLKKVKINASETTIFRAWHKDAEDYYNNSGMSIKEVFNKLIDTHKDYSTVIRPGHSISPQLARPTFKTAHVIERLRDASGSTRPFCVESKFDGERMQVHMCADGSVRYFSRRGIEHGEHSAYSVLDTMFKAHINPSSTPCILDGELLVWNTAKASFEPFGILKPVIGAVNDCLGPEEIAHDAEENVAGIDSGREDYVPPRVKDVELMFVAFDLLYLRHQGEPKSVIHASLSKRKELLAEVVPPGADPVRLKEGSGISGHVLPLVLDGTLFGGHVCCRLGHAQAELDEVLAKVTELGEEGIVVKALDSPWVPNDRGSSSWFKIKPDYITNLDLDCLVIGGWWGSGGINSGIMSQFLLGLRKREPWKTGDDVKYVSFARVGTGLDVEQKQHVTELLRGNLVADPNMPPSVYEVTGKEKPDVWIKDPAKSLIVNVNADARHIFSRTFASELSLRFPTIKSLREDKDPGNHNDVDPLAVIQERKKWLSARQEGEEEESGAKGKFGKKRRKVSKRRGEPKPKRSKIGGAVASRRLSDLSKVERESAALEGCNIFFCNYGDKPKRHWEELVKRLGGEPFMFWSPAVTHIVAAKENATTRHNSAEPRDRDIICLAWLEECDRLKARAPLRPRFYLHMSRATREASEDVDACGDSYDEEVCCEDMQNLLGHLRISQIQPQHLAEALAPEAATSEALARLIRRDPGLERKAAAYVDDQLAAEGLLDARFSLLRPCVATFIQLGVVGSGPGHDSGGAAAAQPPLLPRVARVAAGAVASAARVVELRSRLLRAELLLRGGSTAERVEEGVTHVVGLAAGAMSGGAGADVPVPPEQLLAAVSEQAGGLVAVAALRRGLGIKAMALVIPSWLQVSFELAEVHPSSRELAPTAGSELCVAHREHTDAWPWSRYTSRSPLPAPLAKTAPRAATAAPATALAAAPAAAPQHRRGGRAARKGASQGASQVSASQLPTTQAAPMRAEPRTAPAKPRPAPRAIRHLAATAADSASSSGGDEASAQQHPAPPQPHTALSAAPAGGSPGVKEGEAMDVDVPGAVGGAQAAGGGAAPATAQPAPAPATEERPWWEAVLGPMPTGGAPAAAPAPAAPAAGTGAADAGEGPAPQAKSLRERMAALRRIPEGA